MGGLQKVHPSWNLEKQSEMLDPTHNRASSAEEAGQRSRVRAVLQHSSLRKSAASRAMLVPKFVKIAKSTEKSKPIEFRQIFLGRIRTDCLQRTHFGVRFETYTMIYMKWSHQTSADLILKQNSVEFRCQDC